LCLLPQSDVLGTPFSKIVAQTARGDGVEKPLGKHTNQTLLQEPETGRSADPKDRISEDTFVIFF
jgi:hypothetical protein